MFWISEYQCANRHTYIAIIGLLLPRMNCCLVELLRLQNHGGGLGHYEYHQKIYYCEIQAHVRQVKRPRENMVGPHLRVKFVIHH